MKGSELPAFALKRHLMSEAAVQARYDLGASYAEPLLLSELTALDPAAEANLQALNLGYPGFRGSPAVRAAVAGLYDGLSAEQVGLYSGGDDCILAFTQAFLDAGDHVVVQVPCYQSLRALPENKGCRVALWPAEEERAWGLDLERLKGLLEPDTKAVILNLPHNPTGHVMPRADFQALFALAEERGFVVFVDEIYRFLERHEEGTLPAACEASPQGVSLGAMSKSFGLPGLRLGWLATRNPAVQAALARLRDYHNSTISAVSEELALLALRHREEIWARNRALAAENLGALEAFMERHGNRLAWHPPQGSTVAFPRLVDGQSSDRLCQKLLAESSILLPQSRLFDFGDSHFRIGFGTKHFSQDLIALDAAFASLL